MPTFLYQEDRVAVGQGDFVVRTNRSIFLSLAIKIPINMFNKNIGQQFLKYSSAAYYTFFMYFYVNKMG